MRARSPVIVGAAALVLLAAGCNGSDEGPASGVSVVATTTILGDIAGRVVDCGGGRLTTLMPAGADPHEYAPSSSDVREMARADLVVANGLGLEETLSSALDAAEADGATIFEVAPLLNPIPLVADAADEHAQEPAGSLDPHVWLDVSRMSEASRLIGIELTKVTGDAAYTACGEKAAERLTDLDTQVRGVLQAVPADRRVLVTDHRAFGYFAEAYDFTVAGVLVPGGSTLAQPSAAHLAALVQVLRDTGVPAIFANVAQNSALMDTLAEETGRPIEVVPLYVGSLGPSGSGAEDYPSMMLKDAELITDALTNSAGG
jgi:zinc/manganese transport system substrate-binding protein